LIVTEEQAFRQAHALALAMGITFYVVRDSVGEFAAVQLPPHESEIIATVPAPASIHDRGLGRHRDAEPPQSSRGFI
jgi:hypothetical protein